MTGATFGQRIRHYRRALVVTGTLLVAGVLLSVFSLFGTSLDQSVPTYQVQRGDFRVSLTESGEIRAVQDDKILSPRVRGQLKIVHLWPEGERVLVLEPSRGSHAADGPLHRHPSPSPAVSMEMPSMGRAVRRGSIFNDGRCPASPQRG